MAPIRTKLGNYKKNVMQNVNVKKIGKKELIFDLNQQNK
jgi:hypothetical protein